MSYGVTILIPAYNAEKTIGRTILSIEEQTYKNELEVIVVDDGSTDRTAEIVNRMKLEVTFKIRYFYQENSGVTIARYHGALHAKTDFIVGLDADDELEKDALKNFMAEWNSLSANEKNIYSGICALSRDYQTGHVHGKIFPKNINRCNLKKYTKYRHAGERCCLVKTDSYRRKYKIGEKLSKEFNYKNITEIIMHLSVENDNRLYCVNIMTEIYHTEIEYSLTHQKPDGYTYKKVYSEWCYIFNHFSKKNYSYIDRLKIQVRICWLAKENEISLKKIIEECNIQGINSLEFYCAYILGNIVYKIRQ